MLFNSLDFAIFAVVVWVGALLARGLIRRYWLLAASYYFYGSWKVEYLVLLFGSTTISYLIGLALRPGRSKRKLWLALGVTSNLAVLFAFKYLGFAAESLTSAVAAIGGSFEVLAPTLVLPVGISFYTFQTLSYLVDVYREEREPERDLPLLALYVSFFPQLVAGPIERSSRLLPQLAATVRLRYEAVVSGLWLILWGLFKKVVIADRLAVYVDAVYDHPADHPGFPIWLATYAFGFQVYCDFSGYSDIAVGTARTLGYDLMANFRQPYGARSLREFWQRWHISLSTWFRDYLYIPLGGNRGGTFRSGIVLLFVFFVSGLWHGAAWTFAIWGGLHGLYLLVERWTVGFRQRVAAQLVRLRLARAHGLVQQLTVFHLVMFAWIFFRAESLEVALTVMRAGAPTYGSLAQVPEVALGGYEIGIAVGALLALAIVPGYLGNSDVGEGMAGRSRALRFGVSYALVAAVLLFGQFNVLEFIYFQF